MRRLKLRPSLLIATIVLALPATRSAAAVTCQVNAVEAIALAKQAGFMFRKEATTATRCELINSTIIVAAPQARDATCQFVVFGRQSTESGWRLQNFTRSVSEGTELEVSNLDRGWRLEIAAPQGQTSRVNIRRVHLRGERCTDWRQAFGAE